MLIFVHTGASLCRGHAYLRCYLTGAMLTWIERSWSSLFQETLQAILSTFCSSNALLLKYEATPVNLRSVLPLSEAYLKMRGLAASGATSKVSVSVSPAAPATMIMLCSPERHAKQVSLFAISRCLKASHTCVHSTKSRPCRHSQTREGACEGGPDLYRGVVAIPPVCRVKGRAHQPSPELRINPKTLNPKPLNPNP